MNGGRGWKIEKWKKNSIQNNNGHSEYVFWNDIQ